MSLLSEPGDVSKNNIAAKIRPLLILIHQVQNLSGIRYGTIYMVWLDPDTALCLHLFFWIMIPDQKQDQDHDQRTAKLHKDALENRKLWLSCVQIVGVKQGKQG